MVCTRSFSSESDLLFKVHFWEVVTRYLQQLRAIMNTRGLKPAKRYGIFRKSCKTWFWSVCLITVPKFSSMKKTRLRFRPKVKDTWEFLSSFYHLMTNLQNYHKLETRKSVLHISKQSIFVEIRGVWKGGQTLSWLFLYLIDMNWK